jgi:hypothetical protein
MKTLKVFFFLFFSFFFLFFFSYWVGFEWGSTSLTGREGVRTDDTAQSNVTLGHSERTNKCYDVAVASKLAREMQLNFFFKSHKRNRTKLSTFTEFNHTHWPVRTVYGLNLEIYSEILTHCHSTKEIRLRFLWD